MQAEVEATAFLRRPLAAYCRTSLTTASNVVIVNDNNGPATLISEASPKDAGTTGLVATPPAEGSAAAAPLAHVTPTLSSGAGSVRRVDTATTSSQHHSSSHNAHNDFTPSTTPTVSGGAISTPPMQFIGGLSNSQSPQSGGGGSPPLERQNTSHNHYSPGSNNDSDSNNDAFSAAPLATAAEDAAARRRSLLAKTPNAAAMTMPPRAAVALVGELVLSRGPDDETFGIGGEAPHEADGTVPMTSTFGLHQHYFHRPLPPPPPPGTLTSAQTPQRTPRDGGGSGGTSPSGGGAAGCASTSPDAMGIRSPDEYRTLTPPEGTLLMVGGLGGEAGGDPSFEGIPEGLLATEGVALTASFSLAPTVATRPSDYDAQSASVIAHTMAGNNANVTTQGGGGEEAAADSLSSSAAAAPTSPPSVVPTLSAAEVEVEEEERRPAVITCIDLAAYHGGAALVIGDVHGRVDLFEAKEPRTVLPNAGALFDPARLGRSGGLRASMRIGGGGVGAAMERSSIFSIGGVGGIGGASETPTSEGRVTPPASSASASASATAAATGASGPPPVAHSRGCSFDGGLHTLRGGNYGASSSSQLPPRGGGASSALRSQGSVCPTPSALAAARPTRFTKRCSHQAFVEEFDCRKSTTIDHQLRCVRFLPPNRSPGVTSYLAANEKTIKLFRIRNEQFQHANNAQHSGLIHVRRRSSMLMGGGGGGSLAADCGSPIGGAAADGGVFASNGDYFPVTPRQRFNKRIVMPVKAFTNVHQYNIQSLSLSADSETFLSLDDLQVFWWHLEAQDTTKATKLADLKPESGQPDILLTAAAFHPQNGSIFLVSNSNGACEIGDLRDPPCRKKREYQVTLQVRPELHNTVFHAEHSDILSAISAASFMGRDFVVTRDYLSLKMWDMRFPTHPVAACPVLDFLAPTMDYLYDKDLIFDRFPLAVDDQSMTVATGLYAGTVAVWRPGRESARDPNSQGLRRGTYGDGGSGGDFSSGGGIYNNNKYTYAFDEVEFFTASDSTRVPDERGQLSHALAVGQTSLDSIVRRIVVDDESDDEEYAAEAEARAAKAQAKAAARAAGGKGGARRSGSAANPYGSEADDEDGDDGGDSGSEEEEEEEERMYPRVRQRAHADRVTNVAISPGGDRIAFTTNDHLFTFTRR